MERVTGSEPVVKEVAIVKAEGNACGSGSNEEMGDGFCDVATGNSGVKEGQEGPDRFTEEDEIEGGALEDDLALVSIRCETRHAWAMSASVRFQVWTGDVIHSGDWLAGIYGGAVTPCVAQAVS